MSRAIGVALVLCFGCVVVGAARADPGRDVEVVIASGENTGDTVDCGNFIAVETFKWTATMKTTYSASGEVVKEMWVIRSSDSVMHNSEHPELALFGLGTKVQLVNLDYEAGVLSGTGNPWLYVVPGLGVVQASGRFVLDLNTGALLKEVGQGQEEFAADLCAALTP